MKKLLAIVIFSWIFAAGLHAEPLWGKAEAGASLSAIANIYPDGITVDHDQKNRVKSGAILRYQLEGVQIADEKFNSAFFFLEDKLDQVTLSLKTEGQSQFDCDHTTNAVIEGLKSKYGDPLKRETSESSRNFSWSYGKTTVSLFAQNMAIIKYCSIYIFYNQRIAESANNL